MSTIRLTMAQALLRFLDSQYISVDGREQKFVEGVFGIFGHGNVTGMGEALERSAGSLTYRQGKMNKVWCILQSLSPNSGIGSKFMLARARSAQVH